MENNESWQRDMSKLIGGAVQSHRKRRKLTAAELSAKCSDLGLPIHRVTITKIEGGRSSFDVAELVVIAAALGVPPLALLYPGLPFEETEALPGVRVPANQAADWFSGRGQLWTEHDDADGMTTIETLDSDTEVFDLLDELRRLRNVYMYTVGALERDGRDSSEAVTALLDETRAMATEVEKKLRALGSGDGA